MKLPVNRSIVLFEYWNKEDVLYCHWKSNEHLVEGLAGDTDLDILVDYNNKALCEKILCDCDYLQCNPQYGSRYPNVNDWIGFDEFTGKLIHIHLHYAIITGHKGMKEYNLPWSELCLETRIKDINTNVYIMEPNLELVTLFTRIGLKASIRRLYEAQNGRFKLNAEDTREIEYLKLRVNWNSVHALLVKYYGNKAGDICCIIKRENLDSKDFVQLVNITTSCMKKFNRYGITETIFKKYYFAFALRVISFIKNRIGVNVITRKTIRSSKGKIIVFLGQDGAGKSTVSKEITEWLNWKLEAKKFYLGSGEHYQSWQKKIRNILPQKKNFLTSAISAWLTLSDYVSLAKRLNKIIRSAEAYADKGGIVIFDRFPQVKYNGINDGPKIRSNYVPLIKNSIIKKYAEFCASQEEKYLNDAVKHQVDLVFKLLLSPEESLKRKPEEDLSLVRKKHEIIKDMKFEKADCYDIDATMDYEKELIQIKDLIWQKIH